MLLTARSEKEHRLRHTKEVLALYRLEFNRNIQLQKLEDEKQG